MKAVLCLLLAMLTAPGPQRGYLGEKELHEILINMFRAVDEVKSIRFQLKNTERIDGKMMTGMQVITMQAKPLKVHVRMISPNPGAELLFVEGENGGNAVYEPNGIPYVRMNVDPMGALMRKNNHHTIFEVGFDYFTNITRKLYDSRPQVFSHAGEGEWRGRKGYKVLAQATDFGYRDYTVSKAEDVVSIARKMMVSEYMIVQINKEVSHYKGVMAGQVIKVPTCYAKSVELFIDAQTWLPILQKIYDEKGLYEQYAFTDVELNPVLSPGFFTRQRLGQKS